MKIDTVLADLETIVRVLRYRTEFLGYYEPLRLEFDFEVKPPAVPLPWLRDTALPGHYWLEEHVGPDLEQLRDTVAWGQRVNQPYLPEFERELAAATELVTNGRRWRRVKFEASVPSVGSVVITLQQSEHTPGNCVVKTDTVSLARIGATWDIGAPPLAVAAMDVLRHAAIILDAVEERLAKEIKLHELDRLESRLRISHQVQTSAAWLNETRLSGGAYQLREGRRVWQHSVAADLPPAELDRRIEDGRNEMERAPRLEEQIEQTKHGTRA
jgi:hypothetical protein